MSLSGITIENSIVLWNKPIILLMVLLSSFFVFFGFILLFAGILYPVEIIPEIYSIILSLTVVYVTVISFRNRIIKKIFLISPTKLLEFTYILKKILTIATFSLYLAVFLILIVPTEIYDILKFALLTFSFVFLYFPFFAFGSAITDSGETRIAFEALFSNLNNFNQRQKWLERIFGKLEEKLKKGNMKVSTDKLIYYCNLKLMNSKDIKNGLRDIEHWMLGERIENIVNSIKQIIPEEEIKPIEKISLLDRFFQIPSDVRKYLFLAIIIVIIVVLKPELVEKLISGIL